MRTNVFDKTDWALLREQKQWLIDQDLNTPGGQFCAEGLACFLGAIQDYAIDALGLDEQLVNGTDDEDDIEHNTPCIICGDKETPLHVSGRCGNCGPARTDN